EFESNDVEFYQFTGASNIVVGSDVLRISVVKVYGRGRYIKWITSIHDGKSLTYNNCNGIVGWFC
ncbi:hypothetical protein MKX01_008035, partial [Papaver californicum]